MQTINIHAAKTQFSRLVDAAAAGEEIIIARAGKPVAKLVPLALFPLAPPPPSKRVLGGLAGQLKVPLSFDAPLLEHELAAFEDG